MSRNVRLFVSGDLACFTRPETKAERSSYPLPTPSAARNILDAICWRPEMRWIVTSISLASHPRAKSAANALPQTLPLKRNEVQSTIGPDSVRDWMRDPSTYRPQAAGAGEGTDGTPRMTVALKNVAYILEAYPHVFDSNGGENTPQKYIAMFERRAAKGQCHAQPYLGCREFAAEFRLATNQDEPVPVTESLGRMLYDIAVTPAGRRPVFFNAELKDGLMDTRPEVVLKENAMHAEVLACSYKR